MENKIGLTDLVFRSEKRKKILLFLKEKPRSMEEIQEYLAVDPISILPQLKKLKERKLIVQKDHTYELTLLGGVITDKMPPLVETLEVLEDNFNYWGTRNLEGIPPFLRKRLWELKNCKLVRPDVSHMFELNPAFVENLLISRHVLGFTSYFHPSFTSLYLELANKNIDISFMLTVPILQRLKMDYREDMLTLLGFENVKIFLFQGDPKLADFTVTDRFFLLTLLPKEKLFEHESLLSFEPEALKWGKDLFRHLQKEAVQIKEI